MTVAGRGGRPRKWRNDADRKKAYRARLNGQPEPPTHAQALDDGDELAHALHRVLTLTGELATAHSQISSLQNDFAGSRRELASQGKRWNWTAQALEDARGEAESLRSENAQLHEQLRRAIGPSAVPPSPQPPLPRSDQVRLSRAERRRRERKERSRRP